MILPSGGWHAAFDAQFQYFKHQHQQGEERLQGSERHEFFHARHKEVTC